MPFAPKINQDQAGQAPQAGQASPKLSGVSTSFNVPGSGQAQAPGAAKTQKSSGQFQNIEKYIQANQPQAQQIGQKVGSAVENQITQAQQKAQQLGEQIQKVQEYKPSEVLQNLPSATEEQKKTYQATKQTGGYTGPQDITGLAGYGEAQTATQKAKESYDLLGSEAGQKTLLQQTFNQPQYGGGLLSLDQALLQRSQPGRQELENVQTKYKALDELFKTPITQASQNLTASQEQAAKNLAAFNPAETEAQKAILSPIEQRSKEANLNKPYNEMTADIQDLYLDPQTLEALGLTSGQRIYGTDLSKFLGAPLAQATTQNIATEQERQKYNDLMNFLGINTQDLNLGQPTYSPFQANKEGLAQEIGQRQQSFNKDLEASNESIKGMMIASGNSLPRELAGYLNKPASVPNMKDAVFTFEQKQNSTPTGQQFLNFLNGAAPPSEWGWNNEIANNYRNQYAWYPALKNQLSKVEQSDYSRVINPNKMSQAMVLPTNIQTKLGGI